MWQSKSNFVRPNLTIEGAHVKGTETGSLTFSVDGKTVLTRGGDDTVKRWYSSLNCRGGRNGLTHL
jgi:WD40 repeat protein